LGIETNALQDWEKLIAMRYEEYARDRHGVRAAAMQIESAERGLDLDGLSRIQMLVPLQAVALGCHVYICRGELDGRNDLFQLTLDSLSKFYVEIRVRVEGGTITPLSRMRAVVKEIIYRMKRRAGKK
jgi:aryl carrier-like protein